jgi:hypothetical protein
VASVEAELRWREAVRAETVSRAIVTVGWAMSLTMKTERPSCDREQSRGSLAK